MGQDKKSEVRVDVAPAYSERDSDDELQPSQQGAYPTSSHAQLDVSGLFPIQWNLYGGDFCDKAYRYLIGPCHQGKARRPEPLYSVTCHGFIKEQSYLTLRSCHANRPSSLVAKVCGDEQTVIKSIATVPQFGYQGLLSDHRHQKTRTFTFIVDVPDGKGGLAEETFEWRTSRGKEVRDLDKYHVGWKLVRCGKEEPLAPHPSSSSSSSSSPASSHRNRPRGISSDGKQVLAAFVTEFTWSTQRDVKFQFVGRGSSGELGPLWAIMTVATACRIHQVEGLGERSDCNVVSDGLIRR